jgi:hypothetical protein
METITLRNEAVGVGGGNGDGNCTPSAGLSVLAEVLSGLQVTTNTRVQLNGTAKTVHQLRNCDLTETPIPFTWSLTFQPPGGTETNADGLFNSSSTLSPFFVPAEEGTFRVRLSGHDPNNPALGTKTDLKVITVVLPPPVLLNAQGKLTLLRVNDFGTGFGPKTDFLDVEAVAQLDTQPGKTFGFQLRNDRNRPAHQGMLDLLRDAFTNNLIVSLDFLVVPERNNGVIIGVALVRP